jgi:hypothetical protein
MKAAAHEKFPYFPLSGNTFVCFIMRLQLIA